MQTWYNVEAPLGAWSENAPEHGVVKLQLRMQAPWVYPPHYTEGLPPPPPPAPVGSDKKWDLIPGYHTPEDDDDDAGHDDGDTKGNGSNATDADDGGGDCVWDPEIAMEYGM